MHPQTPWIGYAITIAILCVVLALRLRGMRRVRRLRLETLWIVPVVYLGVTAYILHQFPPEGMQWLWLAAALVLGAALGWRRGALMRITVDPETHALNQQASPAALLFLLVLILIRQGMRYEGPAMGVNVAALTDLLVVFALGLFAATRIEMVLRARRLLAEARRGEV
jgi:hypothetical protein